MWRNLAHLVSLGRQVKISSHPQFFLEGEAGGGGKGGREGTKGGIGGKAAILPPLRSHSPFAFYVFFADNA